MFCRECKRHKDKGIRWSHLEKFPQMYCKIAKTKPCLTIITILVMYTQTKVWKIFRKLWQDKLQIYSPPQSPYSFFSLVMILMIQHFPMLAGQTENIWASGHWTTRPPEEKQTHLNGKCFLSQFSCGCPPSQRSRLLASWHLAESWL